MAAIVPVLPDLTAGNRARDVESILADIEMLAKGIAPDWTDRSNSDPGVVMSQLLAYLLDHAYYQVGRGVTDAGFVRSQRRSSVTMLAQALGYVPDGAVAATVTIQFTLAAPLAGDLLIPKNTQVSGSVDGVTVTFETDVDLVIPVGQVVGSVAASEGTTQTQALGQSNGESYQKHLINRTDVVHNRTQSSLVVTVNGVAWSRVDSFASSTLSAQVFAVIKDKDNRPTIVFGDNSRGKIPPNGAVLSVSFRVGGGIVGNVPANKLTTLVSQLLFAGNPVNPSVTNPQPAQGGDAAESTDSIKLSAPLFFGTQGRAVTAADYHAAAKLVSGVLRATARKAYLNVVEVLVVPNAWDGSALNAALKASVETEVSARRIVTDVALVKAPIPVRPRVNMVVTASRGQALDAVLRAVKASIKSLYDLEAKLSFGGSGNVGDLFLSDIIAAVDATTGVDHVDVSIFTRVPLLIGEGTNGWDIAAGNAVLGSVKVGSTTKDEEWTLTYESPTTFNVRGSVSGSQLDRGTVGQQYTSTGGEVVFTIGAGAVAMAAGNRGRFRTSPVVGNIPVAAGEHAVYRADLDLTLSVQAGV